MPKSPPASAPSGAEAVAVDQVETLAQQWILDCEDDELSGRTLEERREFARRLVWFLLTRDQPLLDAQACAAFLRHVRRGHEEPLGRWDDPTQPRNRQPVRPATAHSWYRRLTTFGNWLRKSGHATASPAADLKPPRVPRDQIVPFTPDQVTALLAAARHTHHPRRDVALLSWLLDTGARASETCDLLYGSLDLGNRRAYLVEGKGGKSRMVPIGRVTLRALYAYLAEQPRERDRPVFLSDRGTTAGEALTANGLLQLVQRLGQAAHVEAVRCSPHTFRHTMAIEYLRAGGDILTLAEILGHSDLTMVRRYARIAEADVLRQHRRFSPADRLLR